MNKFIYPNFTTREKSLLNEIVTIENKFLQGLIDIGGTLFLQKEFTLMGFKSFAMFKVIDDKTILLECISTPYDKRNQGSATKLLKAIIQVADETDTQINLFACNVTGNGFNMAQQMVISIGMVKKNKIPVGKLKGWYQKFGFKATLRDAKQKGWHMEYKKL